MRLLFALALVALSLPSGCSGKSHYDLDGGDLVTVGRAFVTQRGCPACHQSPNSGDGALSGIATPLVASASINPAGDMAVLPGTRVYGSNLTPDHLTGIGDWADIEIVRAMRYGFDARGAPLCPAMPHFDGSDPTQPFMTDLEAGAIVAYLRSLPPITRGDGGIPSSLCPPLKSPPTTGLDMSTDMPPNTSSDMSSTLSVDMSVDMYLEMSDGGLSHD